ncbi:hypothetical protein [Limosilactobacillus fastidiosus]|uniref:Uncharacterized protein n=1 Tax=Limosilactobacillus fastidiosus TaxID=2759855 RepID=A0A7W3U0F2_9LACO|nr:hypothetical protein [Limosilactobacillus fastidiosus]MBB1086360.1 hypothetical protein [Limosilactobacillus fastidiosus]MCD7086265.1 hypothetical protein [Limosilactobacillus fastidiosus]MCD7115028.1 hypothetical protein [Limosilactobacillus fastidiosus]MCD7116809.1 hypothetical protein [Limosilactobacillus fastidiosus]
MKAFMYDQHYGYLLAEIEVADANNLPPYATIVAPDPTKSYQKFNGTEWVGGMDNATFQQQVAASIAQQQANIKPSEGQQLLMAQQTNITQLQKTVMAQQANLTQMQKMIMKQQATITDLKKGSN